MRDERGINESDEVSEIGRLTSQTYDSGPTTTDNCAHGPFDGDIKDLCDIDDDCGSRKTHLFTPAFFILQSIACAGNFFIGVYATLHDWSRTNVGLYLAVVNPLFVCALMWRGEKFST